jgi:hypothetical protein
MLLVAGTAGLLWIWGLPSLADVTTVFVVVSIVAVVTGVMNLVLGFCPWRKEDL